MKVSRKWFNDKFYPLIFCNKRYLVLYGSRGSSKSEFVAQYCILKCLEDGYFKLVYCRKSGENIRESQFSLIKKWLKIWEIEHLFRVYETTMKVECKHNGNTMIAKGVDDPEKVKSTDEPSHIWLEEVTEFDKDDFTTLNDTLRTEKAQCQMMVTFNPIDETHWIRKFLFHPYFWKNPTDAKPNPEFKEDEIVLHHSTFRDNRFIDRDSYERTLRISCFGDENRYNVNAHGLWGVPDKQMKFAWAFDENKHCVDNVEYLPDEVLWLSWDFNVNPMTCIAAQKLHDRLNVLKSFKLDNSNTYQMCQRVKAEYPNAVFMVTGDASGDSLNAAMRDEITNYKIIQQELGITNQQFSVPLVNPSIAVNQILVNAVLLNVNVYIDKNNCQPLIFDLNYVEIGKDKKILKDRTTDEKKADQLDAFRYLCNILYSIDELKTIHATEEF